MVAPAFARAPRAMGAEIREHTEVEGATRSGATFHIACRDGTTVAARASSARRVAGRVGTSYALAAMVAAMTSVRRREVIGT